MTEQQFSSPDSYNNWYQQGEAQNDAEQYEQAIASFDQALQYDSNAHNAWYCKGNALFHLKRYEEAIDCYERAASIKPDSYAAWESRGFALSQLQRYEKAIASLDRALEIRPDNYSTLWARGNALSSLGRIEEAVGDYDKALKIKPDAHEVWALHGNALFSLKRYEQALSSYEKALALQREVGDQRGEVSTLLALTGLYPFNGRIQEGFLAQQRAIEVVRELNPSPDDPLYPLASHDASIPPETMSSMVSSLDKMGWMGKLMDFATKGKLQYSLFFVVWLLFAVVSIAFLPITVAWWLLRRLVRRT